MKKQNKQLTKRMLQDWGIQSIEWDNETNNWKITRLWHKTSSPKQEYTVLKISKSVCKHKYTQSKEYPVVGFSANGKPICFPLARVIYVWFKGSIPEGMVIDHIDNNPFNNKIENLQLLTPEENLKKRFIDNPNGNRNQYDAIRKKKLASKMAYRYSLAHNALVDLTNKLSEGSIEDKENALVVLDDITQYIRDRIS